MLVGKRIEQALVRDETVVVREVKICIVYVLHLKPVRKLIHQPHHYGTALLMTGVLIVLGEFSTEAVKCAWLYALCENILSSDG